MVSMIIMRHANDTYSNLYTKGNRMTVRFTGYGSACILYRVKDKYIIQVDVNIDLYRKQLNARRNFYYEFSG